MVVLVAELGACGCWRKSAEGGPFLGEEATANISIFEEKKLYNECTAGRGCRRAGVRRRTLSGRGWSSDYSGTGGGVAHKRLAVENDAFRVRPPAAVGGRPRFAHGPNWKILANWVMFSFNYGAGTAGGRGRVSDRSFSIQLDDRCCSSWRSATTMCILRKEKLAMKTKWRLRP